MSKEAIIEKIISDGQKKADAILLEAREKADEILADAASECKTYYDQSVYEMNKQVDDILARGKTVAELGAKAQILETVFSSALDKLLALDKKALKGLLVGMLANAEDGDVVIISANEKDVLTEKDVNPLRRSEKDFLNVKPVPLSSPRSRSFIGTILILCVVLNNRPAK